MTSNIGAKYISEKKQLGFLEKTKNEEYLEVKKEVYSSLKKEFKPEFLNRIDEIIIFDKLTDEQLDKIFDILISKIEKRLENKNIKLEVSKNAKHFIMQKENVNQYGARPLKRAIQKYIEDLITDSILDGKIRENSKIKISLVNEKLIVE